MLVYHNVDAEKRDELFRERFREGLYNPELLDVLLRENTRSFRKTADRAVDLGAITKSICSRPNKRVDAFRVTQEMATVNSDKYLVEMKQQVNEITVAMNSLIEMTTRYVSALVSGVSTPVQRPREPFGCFECGRHGHIANGLPSKKKSLKLARVGRLSQKLALPSESYGTFTQQQAEGILKAAAR